MEESKVAPAPVGPGSAVDEQVSPPATLDGASEFEYVEILNPLSVDFVGQFGVERPVNQPFKVHQSPHTPGLSADEAAIRANYGLSLKNPDHQAKGKIVNKVTIPAGQTIRLLGNEAQVVVRQLVTEILQRENKRLFLADPYQRHLVEQRIIMNRGNVQDILGRQPQTVKDQLQDAIKESARESEVEFPDATRPQTEDNSSDGNVEQSTDRDRGNTEKAQPAQS